MGVDCGEMRTRGELNRFREGNGLASYNERAQQRPNLIYRLSGRHQHARGLGLKGRLITTSC